METSETAKTAETKTQVQTFGRESLSPGAYELDLSAVSNMPVKMNGQPSTFVEAYCKLRDSKIKEMPSWTLRAKYITEEGEIQLDCDWTLGATMRELIELTREGIDPYMVTWFYYANDWSRDADVSHTFFVVHRDKLVLESCSFSSSEPRVLKRREAEEDPIWHSHAHFDAALELYWYRRFYTETLTGQLMVLRPDEPILYHYERPQARNVMQEVQFVTLAKIYRLLLVAVLLLAAMAFPSVRNYLAIAAGALGIDFLWLCWRTRKVART